MAASPEQVLTRELRAWRELRGLTAQELSDRIAKHGGKLSRQAISKVENGDRRVNLDELGWIAVALDVPPVLLILPLGKVSSVEVFPGQPVETWTAVKWWVGELRWHADGPPSETFGYFRDHDALVRAAILYRVNPLPSERGAEERLRDLRKNMRRAGVTPPALPDSLADVDTAGTDG